ncbi:unnamed protein product [Nezara viridula]|uniref:Uncharacterized protein n=1 Tax=Nezara viridula TaxID=85310 RepID=A0A9P0H144_NEZVI|nr:unnamed protein product [Nezara viridula]
MSSLAIPSRANGITSLPYRKRTIEGSRLANHLVFQQDSSPAHKANSTQPWLQKNISEFISDSYGPCKRTFQSSSLTLMGPQEARISTR